MTIRQALDELRLPPLRDREEMLHLFEQEVFGPLPAPVPVSGQVLETREDDCAGKAVRQSVRLSLHFADSDFCMPVLLTLPRLQPKALLFHLSFKRELPNEYCLTEEIVDSGYAVCQLCYLDVSSDDTNGCDGLAARFIGEDFDHRTTSKISLWAYAVSRTIDYLKTREDTRSLPVVLIGHSRLGKTALWCSANDGRVDVCYANESGCAGTSLSRRKEGETVADIYRVFPHWFVPAYAKYMGNEEGMPFDQHFLLALTAPRPLYCGSAIGDLWAWPRNEFLGMCAASPAFANGLAFDGDAPLPDFRQPFRLHGGGVGYHLRTGTHFLSREDYNTFYPWLEKQLGL